MAAKVVAVVEDHRALFLHFYKCTCVLTDRYLRKLEIFCWIFVTKPHVPTVAFSFRHVVHEVVRWSLIGDDVGDAFSLEQFAGYGCAVFHDADADRFPLFQTIVNPFECFIEGIRCPVKIAFTPLVLGLFWINLGDEDASIIHCSRKGLRSAHIAKPGRENPFSSQAGCLEMFPCASAEGFVGALQDALGTDINPASGSHLSVHGEPHQVQLVEVFLCGMAGDKVGVGDDDPWCSGMRWSNVNGFSGLYAESLIWF